MDIKRVGPMLLANRYDDRAHFILELLQNADELRRRSDGRGSRTVQFALSKELLRVSHFGQPFDAADVRGICGVGESTKDFTAIGHFGIGFKSVYAFTDEREVHSGAEDFAIESFVWPVSAAKVNRSQDETVILVSRRHFSPRGDCFGARKTWTMGTFVPAASRADPLELRGWRRGGYTRRAEELDAYEPARCPHHRSRRWWATGQPHHQRKEREQQGAE